MIETWNKTRETANTKMHFFSLFFQRGLGKGVLTTDISGQNGKQPTRKYIFFSSFPGGLGKGVLTTRKMRNSQHENAFFSFFNFLIFFLGVGEGVLI